MGTQKAKQIHNKDRWQFVNLTEPHQSTHRNLRRLVRAHATRHVRQEQKRSGISSDQRAQTGNRSNLNNPPHRSDLVALAVCPYTVVGPGTSDPFNTFPISINSDYNDAIVDHCEQYRSIAVSYDTSDIDSNYGVVDVNGMANHRHPIAGSSARARDPLSRAWFPYAMQDATLFLATLSFATVHLDILARRCLSPRALAYKAEVIRSVNTKLSSSEEATSNSTIGAVAMLTAIEVGNRPRMSRVA